MREVSVPALKEELLLLGGVVAQTRVLHPCGLKLHSPGDPITLAHLGRMEELGIDRVYLLEPGEGEAAALQALSTELLPRERLLTGDVLAEDLRGADGAVLARAGAVLGPALIAQCPAQVSVRRRGLATLSFQAREYAAALPRPEARPLRADTRVTEVTRVRTLSLRPLLVPRARVLVGLADEFQRVLVANTLAAEGHEPTDLAPAAEAAKAALRLLPDLLIVDLGEAAGVGALLRGAREAGRVALLAASGPVGAAESHRALELGANDLLPLPARRDVLLEKVRGCLHAQGRGVSVAPAVLAERRPAAREAANFVCGLQDKFLSRPLPVPTARVLDVHEGGLRIEYAAPSWDAPWAVTPHTVHPKHFWYAYSKASPLGRDLTVTLPAPGALPMETLARVVHVARRKDVEVAGLAFQRVRGSVREHLTQIRGKTDVTRRRPSF